MAESQIGFCCGTDCKKRSVLNQISLSFVLQICAQSTTRGLVPLSATTGTISIDFLYTKKLLPCQLCFYELKHYAQFGKLRCNPIHNFKFDKELSGYENN